MGGNCVYFFSLPSTLFDSEGCVCERERERAREIDPGERQTANKEQYRFVGAEKGIYEFHVNMLNRKFVPTNEPR